MPKICAKQDRMPRGSQTAPKQVLRAQDTPVPLLQGLLILGLHQDPPPPRPRGNPPLPVISALRVLAALASWSTMSGRIRGFVSKKQRAERDLHHNLLERKADGVPGGSCWQRRGEEEVGVGAEGEHASPAKLDSAAKRIPLCLETVRPREEL